VCCPDGCGGGDLDDCIACSAAEGAAVDGVCGDRLDESICEDGASFCDGSETCVNGQCTGEHSGDPCLVNVGDEDDDCSESCDEAAGACTANDPDESVCGEGATAVCRAGVCLGRDGDDCAEPAECTSGKCVDEVCCVADSCAPYRCGPGGNCLIECASTADCQPGFSCTAEQSCEQLAEDNTVPSDEGDCGCRLPGGRRPQSRAAWLAALTGGLLTLRSARRGRRPRP
jgi:hypothetical protein